MEEIKKEAPSASEVEKKEEQKPEVPETPSEPSQEQDPVKKELDKVNKKKFSKRERLQFEKKKIDEQLGALNEEEGVESPLSEDKDAPVTVGMLEAREKEKAKKNAIQLADEITDENERELTKHYLSERIIPSGNPQEDLKLARSAVNSLRNTQIAEELNRKGAVTTSPSAPGAPVRHEPAFTPTEQEAVFMSAPWNVSKEAILKARENKKASEE